jgi:hypothetical protein
MVRGYVGHAPMSIHFFGKFAGILAPFLFQYFFFFFFLFFWGGGGGGGCWGGWVLTFHILYCALMEIFSF